MRQQLLHLSFAAALLGLAAPGVQAADTIRLAYLKTESMLPFFHADKQGYFKAEGVDLELVPVQGGPAAAAAVASGSAQLGYAAPTPIIIARDRKLPYKFVFGLQWERSPDQLWGALLASEKSGIRSFKDVAGKTILAGPPGGLCELAWRDWLAKNEVPWSSVKVLTNPFPQHQAMLAVGNADAACVPDPFFSSIRNSNVRPVILGMGYLAEEKRRYMIDGVFATDAWVDANGETIQGIRRAVAQATRELSGNKELIRKMLVEDFRLPPAVAETMKSDFDPELRSDPSVLIPIMEALRRHEMIGSELAATDVMSVSQ